jgi:hypothetical protein
VVPAHAGSAILGVSADFSIVLYCLLPTFCKGSQRQSVPSSMRENAKT